jgi:tetratricopeptide (TPR) repeat protein
MLARPQVESPTALPSSATPTPSPKLEKPFAEETAPKEKPSERESSNLMLGQPQPESTTGQEAPQDYSNWVTLQAEKAEKPQGVGTLVPQAEYAEQAKRLGVQGKLRSSSQITEPAPDSKQSETPETPKAKRPSELKSEQPVISSLVGSGTDAFSQTMRLGQRLLAQGKFYEAYQAYVQSLTIKPNDPMPLFGQANALIGAGDLRSGATQLAAAINKFPKFLRLSLDGARLMGSQSILDRRREQVENLARKNKDPQILLLQGYLELLSGSRNAGFQHLSQSGLVTIE